MESHTRPPWRKLFWRRKGANLREVLLSPVDPLHGAIIATQMASVLQVGTPDAIQRIRRVQIATIAWMSLEATVWLLAG
jgi:hypothetical protein